MIDVDKFTIEQSQKKKCDIYEESMKLAKPMQV